MAEQEGGKTFWARPEIYIEDGRTLLLTSRKVHNVENKYDTDEDISFVIHVKIKVDNRCCQISQKI